MKSNINIYNLILYERIFLAPKHKCSSYTQKKPQMFRPILNYNIVRKKSFITKQCSYMELLLHNKCSYMEFLLYNTCSNMELLLHNTCSYMEFLLHDTCSYMEFSLHNMFLSGIFIT